MKINNNARGAFAESNMLLIPSRPDTDNAVVGKLKNNCLMLLFFMIYDRYERYMQRHTEFPSLLEKEDFFMDLQTFFESTIGQIATVIVLIALFAGVLFSGKKEKNNTQTIVVSALLVALSIALNQIVLFRMPQGGSISLLGMLPIVACAYFFGTRRAVMCGMCVGVLDLIFNPYVIHPVQMLLDYPLAFGAIGFAGIIFKFKKDGIIPSYILGIFCRYIVAVLSGVIFFSAYAPEGFNGLTWSLWYNITYIAVEGAITVAVLCVPPVKNALIRLKNQL